MLAVKEGRINPVITTVGWAEGYTPRLRSHDTIDGRRTSCEIALSLRKIITALSNSWGDSLSLLTGGRRESSLHN